MVEASRSPEAHEPWSIRRLMQWAADDFARRGIDTPRLDAELLLGRAIGLDRIGLIVHATRELAPDELSQFRELVKRRRAGEPIAYILGEREFYGHAFKVDRRVLIPRPDTETLVEAALRSTRQRDMYGRALDLCTGSGCVAIAFAKARPTWQVTAVDVSSDALELARENALRLGAARLLRLIQGDLFRALPAEERFDLIMANPPYVPASEIAGLAVDIREFEPRLALDGGPDGLAVTRRLVSDAIEHLEPKAVLAIEIGHDQAEGVTEEFARLGFAGIERHQDYGGIVRVIAARKP
jgi:release factor glutamine methyltransferase